MGRPRKNDDQEIKQEYKVDQTNSSTNDFLEEVTLEKLVVVDDVAYPVGSKMMVTKEGKEGLISIGALKE